MKTPADTIWSRKYWQFNFHSHFRQVSNALLNVSTRDKKAKNVYATYGSMLINTKLPILYVISGYNCHAIKTPEQVQIQTHFCPVRQRKGHCLHEDFTTAQTYK